ncbi:translocation/assembly module TamB domain-containing protein [Pseudoponticoccus marisrubri]|uniref:Translocation and assembly module TamB C-terminal domain-containing protein n=1 Tax=Pseudoponticoccus marisrubri TaxID=1685382 RepID=A0A0W7WKB1_9RHOB|nr:translocation/assembly module TamB domain-containing protein [Pseudoponticoccus marisrubri]KUF10986.1 hypothetical protein AVJ23_07965 [Pseudoponticoccus marisrubri]
MRHLLVSLLLLLLPGSLSAQAQDSDRGFIQGLLEDALSGPGRTVRLEGFAGALSSRATIDRIVVTDPEGEWLVLDEVALVWTRSALLQGRIEIDEISVGTLSLPRLPVAGPEPLPSPEARSPFSLPELPVSIRLADLTIERAELGAPLFGEAAVVTLSGAAELADGEGNAQLSIDRLDEGGALTLDGAYSNASRVLGLDLSLTEPADGIVANALTLPGRPSLALSVEGEAPIDDFEARVRLDTDGQERLAGSVTLRADGDDQSQSFAVDIGGDLAPVFTPAYREFLGRDVRLVAEGARGADGAITLDPLELSAEALDLQGAAELAPDGWPVRLDLDGQIVPPESQRVLLPLPGTPTRVGRVDLSGRFDGTQSNGWQIEARVERLQRDDITIEQVVFSGTGTLSRDSRAVEGALTLDAGGVVPDDDALAAALGETLRGEVSFDWEQGTPFVLEEMDLAGADYGLTGRVEIAGLDGRIELDVRPDLSVTAEDLGRFAPLAGVELGGAARLDVTGQVQPVSGGFDLVLDGTTRGLSTGIPQADPLLAGVGALRVEARRSEAGLTAELIRIATEAARIEGTARLNTGASRIALDAEIAETGLVLPGVTGRSTLALDATQDDTVWTVVADGQVPDAARLRFDGTLTGDGREALAVEGELDAEISRAQVFSDLAGRPLSGAATLRVTGTGDALAQSFDIDATGTTNALSLSVPQVDPILRGQARIDLSASRDAGGLLTVDRLRIDGPATVDFDGALTVRGTTPETVSGRLFADAPQLSLFSNLADRRLSGAAQVTVEGEGDLAALSFDATAEGQVTNLGLSVPQLDPLLQGTTRFDLAARRDDAGLLVVDRLSTDGTLVLDFDGTLESRGTDSLVVDGRATGRIARLSALSGLTGIRLGGGLDFDVQAEGDALAGPLTLAAEATASGLSLNNPTLDPFLRGPLRLNARATRRSDGVIEIASATLASPELDGRVDGRIGGTSSALDFRLSVADLRRISSDLPGGATVTGTATQSGGPWRIDLSGSGPGGISLDVAGTAGSRLNLSVTGTAPLSLANRRLAPRTLSGPLRVDLSVNGPPALSSVSGVLRTEGARLTDPSNNLSIAGLSGEARLSGGQVRLGLGGRLSTGGRVEVSGPIGLAPPFTSELVVRLVEADLRRQSLFETTANGRVTITGGLAGGARIGGAIDLDTVELRIPQIGPSYSVLDGLEHRNPPADVQRTLMFAGLTESGEAEAGSGPAYPLNLLVNAPSRIFVRGRGLDAELGGSLRLTGTTNDILPVGQFDLIRGRLDLLGRRLTLDEGSVSLRGSFDPVIDFLASSEVEDVAIEIRIAGPASAPELIVSSTPSLPQDEVLALFLFGRDLSSLSALQAVQLAAAVRTLSGEGGLGLTEQLRGGLGVDDLDIGTDADGTAQARVGKYISDNIYTDVTVNAEGESEINLNLNINSDVTVRGRLGSDGDSGIGIFFERDY